MPDASSGLYVLAGASVVEVARWFQARTSRKHMLADRHHDETRAQAERWLLDRREAHAHFLAAASAWHEELLRARSGLTDEAFEVDESREDAVGPALARLELLADDESKKHATLWFSRLNQAASGLSIHNIDPADDLGARMLREHLAEARQARQAYVEAARAELGTTSRTSSPAATGRH